MKLKDSNGFCPICGYYHGVTLKGLQFCSKICYSKYQDNKFSHINRVIYKSFKYFNWRQTIFIRDNFTCQDCRQKGGELHSHHIKSFNKFLAEVKTNLSNYPLYLAILEYSPLWDLDNGITLCKKCHKKRHKKELII
jgi:5-methylcytosine-specific restriction endonuclease McrA